MNRPFFYRIGWVVLFCLYALPLWPQTGEAFNRALILYRNGDYEQAKIHFLSLTAQEQNNPKRSSSLFMLAKTFYNLKDNDNAVIYADRLLADYPNSRYAAFAHHVKGSIYYDQKDYFAALDEFTRAIDLAQRPVFRNQFEATATELLNLGIQSKQVDYLQKSRPWTQAKPILAIWRAQLLHKEGHSDKALALLKDFRTTAPEQRYKDIADKLEDQIVKTPSSDIRIGIILPVSGLYSSEANEFLRGMAFALQQNKSMADKIELLLGDSKGSFYETARATLDMMEMNVDVIVGELEGPKSAMIAGLAHQSDIPTVIPITTDNDLTDFGANIFQTNNSIEVRGAQLAKYAMETLHMKSFATLAPSDEYGSALTDAFANAVDELGGVLVSQQWYYPGNSDFARQFEAIREAGFRHSIRDSLKAWGRSVDPARVDSVFMRMDRQARYKSENRDGLAKQTAIPMTAIDGIFMPVYDEEIPFISSQFALYNIKAGMLGGEYWNKPEELRNQQRYVDGLTFIAGYFFSETDLDYINFARDYRIATSTSPGVMAVYGYNVMNLLLEGIGSGRSNARQIAEYLSQVRNYPGLGTTISFVNGSRVNQYVNILQFLNGNIYRMNAAE